MRRTCDIICCARRYDLQLASVAGSRFQGRLVLLSPIGRTIEFPVLPDALLGPACAAGGGGDTDG